MKTIASIFFMMAGLCLTADAFSASLGLQSRIAVNDKGHRGLMPFKIALAKEFGEQFLSRHQPLEGRKMCFWDGKEQECAYLTLRNAAMLEQSQKSQILRLAQNPCTKIDEEGVRIAYARSFKRKSSSQQSEFARRRVEGISTVCNEGVSI